MKLLIVIPFCKKDIQSTVRLLDWIGALGGCRESECLIVPDFACSLNEVMKVTQLCKTIFKSVDYKGTPLKLPDESHPIGPNWMFETALKQIKQPFLWLEPDTVPTRADWLTAIESEYSIAVAQGKGFLCDVTELKDPRFPKFIPSGVGVYPGNASEYYRTLQLNRRKAWDIQYADAIMPMVQKSVTIHNVINHENPPEFGNGGMKLADLKPKCALFHPSKKGSLIDMLRTRKMKPSHPCFYHSGDLGDILYSLPAVKEIGAGDFYIGPDNQFKMDTRETMTRDRANLILPLLESQSYIKSASFSDKVPLVVDHDLNKCRGIMGGADPIDLRPGNNLARVYLHYYKLNMDLDVPAWLDVQANPVERVIINRTMRYRNKDFRWDLILRKYRGSIGMVGTKHEHEDFQINWGPVRRIETKNLLETAQIIAGAELFIGNQSCCYAIAEGLKQQAILETYPSINNCIFKREPDAKKVWRGCDVKTDIPEISGKHSVTKTSTKSFTLAGHVNWFTALGRELCKLAIYALDHGWSVNLHRLSIDERIPIPEKMSKCSSVYFDEGRPRVLISPLLDVPKHIRPGDIVMTMWESTRIPQGVAQSLNANASLLITPSTWCANTFSSCGVDVPIEIVPLGVDFDMFKPFKRNRRNTPYCFGAAGRLAHGGTRKGIEDVIKSFDLAFPTGTEKVRLSLKLFEDCYIPEFKDKRISYIASTLSDEEMVKWYQTLDCFVSLSKGEGWGNHVHEAIAMGIKIIAPSYGGLAEMISNDVSVDFKIIPATEGYLGHWCQPSIEDSARRMTEASLDMLGGQIKRYMVEDYAESILKLISE